MYRTTFLLVAACSIAGCAPVSEPFEPTLVVVGASVVDPRDGSQIDGASVIVDGDRIVAVDAIDPATLPGDARVIDASGAWVTPGFVDAHVHEASDGYLRRMLAWGVTSIFIMPNRPPDDPREMERLSETAAAKTPRMLVSKMFTGEYPDNQLPGVYDFLKPDDEAQARELVDELFENGFEAIKIIQDDGRPWGGERASALPLDEVVFKALVSEARSHGMRVYVHTAQLAAADMAFATGVDALLHGTMDGLLADEHLRRMQAGGIVWVPTNHALYWFGDHARYAERVLEDPRFAALMDQIERDQLQAQAESEAPILVEPSLQFLVERTADYIGTIERNTRAVAAAGIPIAVGSDGGPGGVSTHLEMQLLQTHGLSATQALAAATYGGALALDRADEIGTVEAGKLADFVVLNADPREDITNAREIAWVVKGGVAYTPRELAAPMD